MDDDTALALDKQVQESLNEWKAGLPKNYNFELDKTVERIRRTGARRVALQLPEGLLMFATVISDILQHHCPTLEDTVIMGDVTYGACCIDDWTAHALGCDLLVHYAHSCLIPVNQCTMKNILYIFVDIQFDLEHCIQSIKHNFPSQTKMAMVSTIQFVASLRALRPELAKHFEQEPFIPQIRPLSPGEILGCTSPTLDAYDAVVYIGDGRFHLESTMIANPDILAYKYDPYSKVLSREKYEHSEMHSIRRDAIARASKAKHFGIILGTLGRQGSPRIMEHVKKLLRERGKPFVVVLLSEIFPQKLQQFREVEAWIQIACPRLSIDWGFAFDVPLLTPYEIEVALDTTEWRSVYPMDFYSADGGTWTVNYGRKKKSIRNVEGGGPNQGQKELTKEEKRRLMKEKLQRMKQKRRTKDSSLVTTAITQE